MDFNGYKSWHIPRASLSSASNSGQSSTDSVRNYDRRQSDTIKNYRKHRSNSNDCSVPSSSSSINVTSRSKIDGEKEKIHRGSRSSQGSSSDGISSMHSASSLLLSVANLENFTKMQENSSRSLKHGREWIKTPEASPQVGQQNHLVLNITSNHKANDAKDFDQVSIASSTHFTVVNGFGRANIKPKSNSLCRQGRQLTILIMTMSILFMIGIIGAIYLMERRARAMPAYHQ